MMMINVPWHFKVDACTARKEKKKKKNAWQEPLFTSIIIPKHPPVNSSIYWLARYHTNLKLDLTIIFIS